MMTARTRGRLQHIGFVYQFHNLLPEFSALENIMLPLRLRGRQVTRPRGGGDILAKLGLTDRLEHLPAQLSGGEQQRVAIARALVTRPDVILAMSRLAAWTAPMVPSLPNYCLIWRARRGRRTASHP